MTTIGQEAVENYFGNTELPIGGIDFEGASGIANVSSFRGAGRTDTEAINAAINSLPLGGIVIVPYGAYDINAWEGGTHEFPIGGVRLKDNITLLLTGATLKVIPNNQDGYCCINITNCTNVQVIGGTLIGDRYEHMDSGSGRSAQWGTGVSVQGSSDVYLKNIVTKNFHGDGFSIGEDINGLSSANVNMDYCKAENSRRNGLSVTSCYGGTISRCTFRLSNGHSPECGIDMEPNPGKVVTDMVLENNRCLENYQHGILFASIQSDTRSAQLCVVSKNDCRYNRLSGIYTNRADRNVFSNNICAENGNNGMAVLESNDNVFSDNYMSKNDMFGFMMGDSSQYNMVSNNAAYENAQLEPFVDHLYDNFVFFDAHHNNIQGNKAKIDNQDKVRYGMYIAANCIGNIVTNNDLFNSGVFAGFNNASPTTVKAAGNQGNDAWITSDFN